MITKLYLENFRSIRKADIELRKINVLTGPNTSGKSSIIYGLLALKNVVGNPSQNLDSFVSLGSVNLGGFTQTVHLKNDKSNIILGIDVSKDGTSSQYTASLGKEGSELRLRTLRPLEVLLKLEVSFPYPTTSTTGCKIEQEFGTVQITWNGITPKISYTKVSGATPIEEQEDKDIENIIKNISDSLNAPIDELRSVDFIPIRRGFTKPIYSSVPMREQLLSEDELATLLATNRDLQGKVAFYLEKIIDRIFYVWTTVSTANFNLQMRDKSTGFVCDLVNDGFGANQLVTILTKCLKEDVRTVCIEEPEIHLHPEMMSRLVDVFIDVAREEHKNFIISTHSEHIVLSLLNKVAQKKISPDDVRIYFLSKDGKKTTKIEKQEVNEKGQIEGGLKGFFETELREVKEFFKIPEGK